jgi:molybdenum cofactor biosynthesis enzyme MoaA
MSLIKPHGVQRMKVDDYRRVAQEAMELGVIDFSFQGGEIFLAPEYEEVIKVFQPEKNLISVTTNGTLLNLERIKIRDLISMI